MGALVRENLESIRLLVSGAAPGGPDAVGSPGLVA
jgi:hypothetical protein